MKKLLVLLFVVASLAACKKDTDVQPQSTALADKFTGTYKLSSFRYTSGDVKVNFSTLPMVDNGQTVASGTVKLSKAGEAALNLAFLLKTQGNEDVTFSLDDLAIKQEGGEYGLYAEGVRIADVEGSLIIFNYSATDPATHASQEIAFIANR
ncbi:hypothetical protein [Spirosoma fluminis]